MGLDLMAYILSNQWSLRNGKCSSPERKKSSERLVLGYRCMKWMRKQEIN